jgi:hypothetical protein
LRPVADIRGLVGIVQKQPLIRHNKLAAMLVVGDEMFNFAEPVSAKRIKHAVALPRH